jgi:hypothetical protein
MSKSFSGATDLLGDTIAPTKRTNDRPEAAALCEVLKALKAHPAVAWCERMNSGAAKIATIASFALASRAARMCSVNCVTVACWVWR